MQVLPADAVAARVTVPLPQCELGVTVGEAGVVEAVTLCVSVASQPSKEAVTVYVPAEETVMEWPDEPLDHA